MLEEQPGKDDVATTIKDQQREISKMQARPNNDGLEGRSDYEAIVQHLRPPAENAPQTVILIRLLHTLYDYERDDDIHEE